ncbi:MAG: UDP-N-acetylmuramoyl-L-alanine--D-glutamate ligase [Clostridia bacterium]|nr:UDP-N-acetylmuramoyl-L-alanine--D-glutamate ligase [Clostridia bacterium]
MYTPAEALKNYLEDKSILLLGYGREGKSTHGVIRRLLPDKRLTVADAAELRLDDPLCDVVSGGDYLDGLEKYDLIIKSPGVPLMFDYSGIEDKITCQLDLFLRFARCRVVGVTGTKGKTTTTTLTYSLMAAAGEDAHLCGNMGIPVLDFIDLPEDAAAVIEMSSHQLQFTRSSPDVAIVTNLYPEHLDHHPDGFEGYKNAKLNIVRHQTASGYFVYDKDSDLTEYPEFFSGKGTVVGASAAELPDVVRAACDENPRVLAKTYSDCALARAAAMLMCAKPDPDEDFARAMAGFGGIEHRLEFFGSFRGIDFYNDAIATVPAAAINAVESVKNAYTLIVGGLDRGIDYSDFIEYLKNSRLSCVLCTPDTGNTIFEGLRGCGKYVRRCADLEAAVCLSLAVTPKGGAVILSPAAASYNLYKNFEEKGREFKRLVRLHGSPEALEELRRTLPT